MLEKQISLYKRCLQEHRYYDAHEALEELWFPRRFEQSNEVKILKAFINAAVSFELHKRGRPQQSAKVWQNYLKYRGLLFKVGKEYLPHFYRLSREIEEHKRKNSLFHH